MITAGQSAGDRGAAGKGAWGRADISVMLVTRRREAKLYS